MSTLGRQTRKPVTEGVLWGLTIVLALVTGCQTTPAKQAGIDNTGFMSLWNTYSRCRVSSDVSEATRDAHLLAHAAQPRYSHDGFVLPLPAKLQQLVTNPQSRFAVDVRAMASACSLHAGQLALDQGHPDLARHLLTTVIALHEGDESSYYRVQANGLLLELERGVDVSLIPR